MITTLKAGKDIRPLQMPQMLILAGLGLGALADLLWVQNGFMGPGFVLWAILLTGTANGIYAWRSGSVSRGKVSCSTTISGWSGHCASQPVTASRLRRRSSVAPSR